LDDDDDENKNERQKRLPKKIKISQTDDDKKTPRCSDDEITLRVN